MTANASSPEALFSVGSACTLRKTLEVAGRIAMMSGSQTRLTPGYGDRRWKGLDAGLPDI